MDRRGVTVDLHEVPSVATLARSRTHGGMLLQVLTAERDTEPRRGRRVLNLPRVDGRFIQDARTEAFDDDVAALAERDERALFPERQQQLQTRLLVLFSPPRLDGRGHHPRDASARRGERPLDEPQPDRAPAPVG